MIKVTFKPNIIDNELILEGVVLQIATDSGFTNIVHDSGNDFVNLYTHSVNKTFIAGSTYYVRGRFIYNLGLSDWITSSLIITANSINNLQLENLVPEYVRVPKLLLEFNGDEHPNSFFKVSSGYNESIRNPIVATTWVIEDTYGEVIYYEPESNTNVKDIRFGDILKKNKVYVIKARHILASGDSSLFGGRVIYASGDKTFTVLQASTIQTLLQVKLTYNMPLYGTTIEYTVWKDGVSILTNTSNNNEVDISSLIGTHFGIVQVKSRATNGILYSNWDYQAIRLLRAGETTLPVELPHSFNVLEP